MEFTSRLISFFLIIFLAPIFLFTSFLCLIFQGMPIIFKQKRVGYKFRQFNIYKFRSMVQASGDMVTSKNDKRITLLGKFLRNTKIDEIPQLINILKGDMRFIGPRPEVLMYFNESDFGFLKNVKPGISDFSSIILRNENEILEGIGGDNPYEKLLPIKIRLANYYSRRKSFPLDFKLVLITILSIFFPDYASRLLINNEISSIIKDLKDILLKKNKYNLSFRMK